MNLSRLYRQIPDKWIRLFLFYSFSLAFVLLNAWLVLKKDTLLGVLFPVLLMVLVTALFSYQKLIWLVILLTPLSVPLKKLYYGLPFDMFIPTEPLLAGILILFLISIARGQRLDFRLTRHPVAIAIYFYLAWMLLTVVSSTLPLVSLKFVLARIWYVVIFFFLLTVIFRKQENISKFVWFYTAAFVLVIIYTLVRHTGYGLNNHKAAHWVMTPFFNDHTSYGAVLAMFIPFLIGFSFARWIPVRKRVWIWALLLFFVAAEIFSYSRAAWLSLIVSFGVWGIMRLRIRFKTLMITGVSILAIAFVFQKQLLMKLEQNSTDSSSNLMEHVTSMTNISTDASNLERINRWQCALAMFKEKPVLGWGPGTYAMNYAPFQLTRQRTIISTNSGDGGNAHSEYLGSMAESGLPGLITLLALLSTVLYTGIRAYTRSEDQRIKTILMASVMALITYYTHSFLNNFLDTDKASVPFWGFTAIIVALDIYTREEKKKALKVS
ncbi:O-antigen ligase family protein [Roseimarinus sediminis]|uniref:O-antigen ligase family protein n=1 Tax=Roseimarinus sediminis TaxID=1610899 RepID=UPI003D1F6E16